MKFLQSWVILTRISGEIVNGLSEGTEEHGRCSTAPAPLVLEKDYGVEFAKENQRIRGYNMWIMAGHMS